MTNLVVNATVVTVYNNLYGQPQIHKKSKLMCLTSCYLHDS